MLGMPAQNTYSEVHYATQAAYARAQYEIALDNLEMGGAELLGMCARTVEWLDNDIAIRNVNPGEQSKNIEVVASKEIKGYYQSRVKFIGDTPEGRQTRERQGLELLRQKALPHLHILMDYFDIPRGEAEQYLMDLDWEKVNELPPLMMAKALEVADQRGDQRGFQMVAMEMLKMGMEVPLWAQMKLGTEQPMAQDVQARRGGDHRQPAELETAAEKVPLHAEQNVQGPNPREVSALG